MLICVRLFVFVCSVLFVVWHYRSQYKGRFNFWRLGHGHLEMNGISQWHDFPASHHFAGPHDSIGKHPGIEIDRQEKFEKARLYDYDHCYEWCRKYMSAPSTDKNHSGTWACNGN